MEINAADVVLCEFYFSDLKTSKKRPVIVFRHNHPYDDFVGIPISSQLEQLHPDEHEIDNSAFSYRGIPKKSKLILSKPFVILKTAIIKIYGTLNETAFKKYHSQFYFLPWPGCGAASMTPVQPEAQPNKAQKTQQRAGRFRPLPPH